MAGRWRRFVLRPFVWLLALVAIAAWGARTFLHSELARSRARRFAEARLGEALGRKVRIERLDFQLVPLRVVVRGVEIAPDRPGEPPLLRLAEGEIEADLAGLRSRLLDLQRVALRGLDLALVFRDDGSDNLPRLARGGGAGGLAVRIGGLTIDDSRVRVDERSVPLAVDATAVLARLVGADARVLDGSVAAQEVELRLPGAKPLAVAFSAAVRLEGDRVALRHVRVRERDLDLTADGTIGLTAPSPVELTTHVATRAALLDRLGWLKGELDGDVAFDGRLFWQGKRWSLDGALRSPRLAVIGFVLDGVGGELRGGPRGFDLAVGEGTFAGGALGGRFAVDLAERYPTHLEMTVAGGRIQPILERFDLPVRELRGAVSGEFRYDFSLVDAENGDGGGSFVVGPEPTPGGAVAAGEVGVKLAGGRVAIEPLRWSAGGQSVDGRGEVDLARGRGSFDLGVRSEEIAGLVRLLPFLDPAELWVPAAGTADATVRVEFAGDAVAAAVDFAGGGLEAKGFRATRASGHFDATASAVTLSQVVLERPGARLTLAGHLPLDAKPELDLTLAADGWPLADAAPWLPFVLPASGPARGRLHLAGSLAALRGEGDVEVAPAIVAGLAAPRLRAAWRWDDAQLELASAALELAAGTVTASGTMRFADEALDVALAPATLALERAPFDALGSGRIAGTLRLGGHLGGTLARPELALDGTLANLTLAGAVLPADPPATLAVAWKGGELATRLDVPGILRLEGGGELLPDADARLRFALSSADAGRLAALVTGDAATGLAGSLTAELEADWPRAASPTVVLRVPELDLTWQGKTLRSREPLLARFDGEFLALESVYLQVGEADDELFVGGRIGVADDPTLDLHVEADLAAAWASPLVGTDLGGRLGLLANLRGTAAHPAWSGQGEWRDGRFIPPGLPHSFERGRALVLLYPQAIVLDGLSGSFAGGTITGSGRVDLAAGAVKDYRFEAAARGLGVRWPAGWQLRGDADLTLVSTRSGRQIAGQARLDRIFYFQNIDLSPTQLLERLLARSRVVVPETDELLASTALDVVISAPDAVRVRNNVADLSGSASLALRGSLARPVLFGDVNTAAGSKVVYNGNTFAIDRGHLTFANPARIDPQLDIVARTRISEYDVTFNLAGLLSRPVTSFASDPPLPDLEILGLLSSGGSLGWGGTASRATQVASTDPNVKSASTSAEALLYGQAASLVGARVGRLFGFDQVRVEPLTSGDTVSTARVTVGKRLSSRLALTYSVDPSSTAQQILQVEYRVSDKLVLVLTQNGNESYSVDTRWESRF